MSAFVVEKSHLDAMIRAALVHCRPYMLRWIHGEERHDLTSETATRVGQMLLDECLASVRHRYPGETDDTLPGPEPYWGDPYRYPIGLLQRCPEPVEALKLLACYEYQSCEHSGWWESEARAFCEAMRRQIIPRLDGYEEAPWEWEVERDRVPASTLPEVMGWVAPPAAEGTPPSSRPFGGKFSLGQTVMTRGIAELVKDRPRGVGEVADLMTRRHARGDWGEVDEQDRQANEAALRDGTRLMSVYTLAEQRVYIITEADRSSTTILLPEEY